MGQRSEFLDHVLELLAPVGWVEARPMFGGHGLYRGEAMFAIVFDDALYLKADADTRAVFEREGLEPFRYERQGGWVALSYYQPPADALEDSALLCAWARKALEAARRGRRGD